MSFVLFRFIKDKRMRSTGTTIILLIATVLTAFGQDKEMDYIPRKQNPAYQNKSVDHSKFPELHKDFTSPQQVTNTCLSCHTERGMEVMKTAHWNWEREAHIEGRGVTYLGKQNLINNFCTGISGSEGTCTRCHIGYGYDDKSFDFSNQSNIDCLVCHDNSGTYTKAPGAAGYPYPQVDLSHAAQSVGYPKKNNCGVCHFYSAGGNNVKNGTLDKALLNTTRDVDVHMAKDGPDMACVECHITEKHQMKGKYYGVSSMNRDRATCAECHTEQPHDKSILNEHTLKVSCQTCHIPTYAKVNPTKINWDWSTATKLDENGKPYAIDNDEGHHSYLSIKGSFKWGSNLEPDYIWFNGTADHHLLPDKIQEVPVQINTLNGSYNDKQSKIWPVKIHTGKQPYDKKYNTLIQVKLWDKEKGKGALWKDFDWAAAAEAGMEYVGLPYSGEYGFIETEMTLPLSHMVSPADQSLSCTECHTREDSRLEGLSDFYMPGRDYNAAIDNGGVILIILSLVGVAVHAVIRIMSYRRRKKEIEPIK